MVRSAMCGEFDKDDAEVQFRFLVVGILISCLGGYSSEIREDMRETEML